MAVEAAVRTTAEDILKRKSNHPNIVSGIVSGGHLVAKALEAEGVDARHD